MTTDALGISTNTKRKKSFLAEEEDIIVKPSTELIPDEYQAHSGKEVLLHIFQNRLEDGIANDFMDTMEAINYPIHRNNQLHYLTDRKTLFNDLITVKEESADRSALVLVFIGFCKNDGFLYIENDEGLANEIHVKDIWSEFTANNCPDLKYKPKIFIFCTSPWSRSTIATDSKRHRTLCFDKVYDFPAESDLLIVYNKTDDKLGRSKQDFLQQLCYNIEKYSKKYDIIDLVSHMQKSVPLVISTLTRRFFLTPSNEREHYLTIAENNDNLEVGLKSIKEAVQKLHDVQKNKKESKFLNFSFRKKSEDKPKITKRKDFSVVPKIKEVVPSRFGATSSIGTRSRHQSETEYERRTSVSGASASGTVKKRPVWRN